MKYEAMHCCSTCSSPMSYNTKMYSHGVCPFCGASSGCTVVDTITKSVLYQRVAPKWKVWNTKKRYTVVKSMKEPLQNLLLEMEQ